MITFYNFNSKLIINNMSINFNSIKFVIPSYNRVGKVKTLQLLNDNNIPITQIYLFVIQE